MDPVSILVIAYWFPWLKQGLPHFSSPLREWVSITPNMKEATKGSLRGGYARHNACRFAYLGFPMIDSPAWDSVLVLAR